MSCVIISLGEEVTEQDVKNLIKEGDKNDDGVIDFNEFVFMMTREEDLNSSVIEQLLDEPLKHLSLVQMLYLFDSYWKMDNKFFLPEIVLLISSYFGFE